MAHVPEVVPRSTNHGERPSEERRSMIFACWGRYETRIPTRMKLRELLAAGGANGMRGVHGDGEVGDVGVGESLTALAQGVHGGECHRKRVNGHLGEMAWCRGRVDAGQVTCLSELKLPWPQVPNAIRAVRH